MDKNRKEAIDFFVKFANMNLNELNPGDKAKLLVESEEYLFFKASSVDDLFLSASTDQADVSKVFTAPQEDMDLFSRKMKWAFKPRPNKDSAEYWSMLFHLQVVIKDMLSNFAIKDSPFEFLFLGFVGWESGKKVFFPLSVDQDDYLNFKISYLLSDGPPRATVHICPAPKCNKIFINTSLRKKTFCSPRCMWRFNTAERRKGLKKKDPKKYRAYLDKQRELMARKYEKNIHTEHPKAKVAKHTRKTRRTEPRVNRTGLPDEG